MKVTIHMIDDAAWNYVQGLGQVDLEMTIGSEADLLGERSRPEAVTLPAREFERAGLATSDWIDVEAELPENTSELTDLGAPINNPIDLTVDFTYQEPTDLGPFLSLPN